MTGALDGIRVLDFTWYAAGPISTKYLADNGAEVIKVESQTRLDNVRNAAPWKDATPGVNRSQFFGSFNSSKKSITINMREEGGRELGRQLVGMVDVVIDSLSAGHLQEWGLGYEDNCKIKPDIIQVSTTMQGQYGPRAMLPGFGTTLSPLSGFDSITGYGQFDLAPAYGAYTDFIVPRFVAFATLSAIEHHRRTGEGQFVDVSQYEAAVHFLAPAITDYFATGTVMEPRANRSHRYSPHGAYRTADEDGAEHWIAIAVENDDEWQGLLRVLRPDVRPQQLATHMERLRRSDEVDEFLAPMIRARERAELAEALQAAGVSAYPLQSCLDLRADENMHAFGFWPWLDQTECGPMPYDGLAYRLERTPGEQTAAPNVGEHNEEILGGLLGLSPEEIQALVDERIVY